MVGDRTAVDNGTMDLGLCFAVHLQLDQAVIDQDAAADLNIFRQVFVCNGSPLLVAQNFLCCQSKGISLFQGDLSVLEITQTDLGAFGIQQRGYRNAHLFPEADQALELGFMLRICAVGKIETRYIHTGVYQFPELFFTFTGRTDRTYDLCFSHSILPLVL